MEWRLVCSQDKANAFKKCRLSPFCTGGADIKSYQCLGADQTDKDQYQEQCQWQEKWMNIPKDEKLVIQSYLSHMATFWGASLSVQRLCVFHIPQEGTTYLPISWRVFTYTFGFCLSYHSSIVLFLPNKMLMPSGLFCNDSLNRKNKFLRKSEKSTATLYSPLATVRKPCDAHSAALTEFSI